MWPSDFTLAMTLTLSFQGQIWNFLYLGQKWSDGHETKNKRRLNSTLQMWLLDLTLAMTLTLNIQAQIGIWYISAKNGPIAMEWKATILIEL